MIPYAYIIMPCSIFLIFVFQILVMETLLVIKTVRDWVEESFGHDTLIFPDYQND